MSDQHKIEDQIREWRRKMPPNWYGNPRLDASADEIASLRAQLAGAMDSLADVPGDTLDARLTKFIGYYMAFQIEVPALRAQLASARKALEPFAAAWTAYGDKPSDDTTLSDNAGTAYLEGRKITFGNLRRAHIAYTDDLGKVSK